MLAQGEGILSISLLIPKKNGEHFTITNLKPMNQFIHYLHKVHDDLSETNKGGHLCRAMGSLTQHQVNILPHSNSKETLLLPLLQVERQSLPVQDLAPWSIHCPLDLYEDNKAHPVPMQGDGYNSVSIPR